jgi:hypothetical protein
MLVYSSAGAFYNAHTNVTCTCARAILLTTQY